MCAMLLHVCIAYPKRKTQQITKAKVQMFKYLRIETKKQNKIPSALDATEPEKELHMWKHLLLHIWKLPAPRQKSEIVSKLFMQNSSFSINCTQVWNLRTIRNKLLRIPFTFVPLFS